MEKITLLEYTQCKPMFSTVLVHMEYVSKITCTQSQNIMAKSILHARSSDHLQPTTSTSISETQSDAKTCGNQFVCICALVSGVILNLALPCTSFSCNPAMQANCEPINSVTSNLHTQAAPAKSRHMHYTDHHGLSKCICPLLAIACRAVSGIVLFSCCAMQMFSSQHEKNMEREC